MRFFRVMAGVIAVATMSWVAFAHAQVPSADNESESDEPGAAAAADAEVPTEMPEEMYESRVMDEITVIGGPQGRTAFEIEMDRQARMREAIYAQLRLRERDQEELAWRQADPDLKNPESRIKWGYSPQAELRMRQENDFMHDLSIGHTKPASLFRAEF